MAHALADALYIECHGVHSQKALAGHARALACSLARIQRTNNCTLHAGRRLYSIARDNLEKSPFYLLFHFPVEFFFRLSSFFFRKIITISRRGRNLVFFCSVSLSLCCCIFFFLLRFLSVFFL